MKVLVVGATGTIGGAVSDALASEHEVVRAARTSGDCTVDIASPASIETLLEEVGAFDAVVSAAGNAAFGPLEELSDEDFQLGLENKLMGQINLVRRGLSHIRDQGSFTLTSGVLSLEPTPGSAAMSLVNSGLEGFVRAAALELPRDIRINVVSPPWVRETLEEMGRDGSEGMPAAAVARAYVEAVEGRESGQIIDARDFG